MKKTLITVVIVIIAGLFWCASCQKTVAPESSEVVAQVEPEQVISGPFNQDFEKELGLKIDNNYEFEVSENPEGANPLPAGGDDWQPELNQTARGSIRAQFIARGIKLTPLTDDGKSSAVGWAYHGNKIAFIRDMAGGTQRQLMIMNADGTGEETVTPIGYPYFAEWSWKSDKLVYEFANTREGASQSGVFVYDLVEKKATAVSAPVPDRVRPEPGTQRLRRHEA